jgi:hypothetical protein
MIVLKTFKKNFVVSINTYLITVLFSFFLRLMSIHQNASWNIKKERHEIDKFKSWNFTPPSFEELHGNDVYHSRYVAT